MENDEILCNSILDIVFFYGFLYSQEPNPNFDPELAKRLGADDYGMKKYVFVLLKPGENTSKNQGFIDSCFVGHMNNIQQLVKEGKMVVAGPMLKTESDIRGVFILNVETIEEAKDLLNLAPAIKEKFLKAELFEWYGSAALPTYLDFSDKVKKVRL